MSRRTFSSNYPKSFYWLDYETFGTDPATDWPCQFAGIRTDADFNEIGEPLNINCRLPGDHLPHPAACLVTGLTPERVNRDGLIEPEFIELIHQQLLQPGTCSVGYNSIRFDDEVTRNVLYRNFHDPYAREWKHGNSRWDLIDLVRLVGAIRPEGIIWPKREDGYNSYRLEELTAANGLEHGDAHDALSDVRATIALARLIREKQPKAFDFALGLRNKRNVLDQLNLGRKEPVVHVSGMFGAARHCLSIVVPLAMHPVNKNGVIVCDLCISPDELLELTAEGVAERLFTPLTEDQQRIPLKVVNVGRSPVVAPLRVLTEGNQQHLGISLTQCLENRERLLASTDLIEKVKAVYSSPPGQSSDDPDQQIYSGGFFDEDDKQLMSRIRKLSPDDLGKQNWSFKDTRLEEMLFRYRGRHYPETLGDEEKRQWWAYCKARLGGSDDSILGFDRFHQEMLEARNGASEESELQLLDELASYAERVQSALLTD